MPGQSRLFIQRVLVGIGIVMIIVGLAADWLGIGTSGFGFGPGQIAVILSGIGVVAWSITLYLEDPIKKYLYSIALAITLFLLWYFWLYPSSGYSLKFAYPASLTSGLLVVSHLVISGLSILSVGTAIRTIWYSLQKPHQRESFVAAHALFISKKKTTIFVIWILLWIIGFFVAAEFISRRLVVVQSTLGKRPIHPYLINGNFYEYYPDQVMMEREGPAAYGYQKVGGIYIYGFENKISSITDRGDFLFQDRVSLANDSSRTDITRIFVIGGSAAYGTGASSKEKRWYMLLENALSRTFAREVRLIPAAMGAYNSTQERLVLELMVLPRSPDGIIIFDGFNDTSAINRPGDPYNQGALYAHFYSLFFGLKKWFVKHSFFYHYLVNRSLQRTLEKNRRRILENPVLLTNYTKSVASVYLDNIFNMVEHCRDQGIPCVVFLQPARALTLRNQGIQMELSSQETLALEAPSQEVLTLAAYDEILKRIYEFPSDIPIYDLTSAFDIPGSEAWFSDVVHFTDPGHKVIADLMYPVCRDIFRKILDSPSEENSR